MRVSKPKQHLRLLDLPSITEVTWIRVRRPWKQLKGPVASKQLLPQEVEVPTVFGRRDWVDHCWILASMRAFFGGNILIGVVHFF